MFTAIRILLTASLKGIIALVLGGAILGMVARNCGPREGVAYIHVAAAGVDVTIGDSAYRVESPAETPIVCSLPPGPHVLRMSRAGTVLYEVTFVLEPGREVVLCAYERRGATHADFLVDPEPRAAVSRLTAAARRPRP
jgi:hypothetical protein